MFGIICRVQRQVAAVTLQAQGPRASGGAALASTGRWLWCEGESHALMKVSPLFAVDTCFHLRHTLPDASSAHSSHVQVFSLFSAKTDGAQLVHV